MTSQCPEKLSFIGSDVHAQPEDFSNKNDLVNDVIKVTLTPYFSKHEQNPVCKLTKFQRHSIFSFIVVNMSPTLNGEQGFKTTVVTFI